MSRTSSTLKSGSPTGRTGDSNSGRPLWLAVSLSLGVPVPAQAADTLVGATVDYAEVGVFHAEDGATEHYDTLGAHALVDLEFLRLAGGFTTNIGNYIRFIDGREEQDGTYRIQYVSLTAMGKYPFRFADGTLALWPGLGLRGAYGVRYSRAGTAEINRAPHDLFLLLGAGVDWTIAEQLGITGSLLVAYNLTPGTGEGRKAPQVASVGLGLGAFWRL
jgi:hypothetical protein